MTSARVQRTNPTELNDMNGQTVQSADKSVLANVFNTAHRRDFSSRRVRRLYDNATRRPTGITGDGRSAAAGTGVDTACRIPLTMRSSAALIHQLALVSSLLLVHASLPASPCLALHPARYLIIDSNGFIDPSITAPLTVRLTSCIGNTGIPRVRLGVGHFETCV